MKKNLKYCASVAVIMVCLLCSGCSADPIHAEADRACYEALRPAYFSLANPAVEAGTLRKDDYDQNVLVFESWKSRIEARDAK